MASVRKFTFDLRFDDPESGAPIPAGQARAERTIAAPPPPPPPPPEPEPEVPAGPALIYSEEDMEIAREEAYVAGHMRALEEAQAATEQAVAGALMSCRDALTELQPVLSQKQQEMSELAAHVAAEICRKLLPSTSENYAIQEICALVRSLMPSLIGQPRLLVRVHADLVNNIREPLENIAFKAGFEGKVVILEGDAMALSDARIEWPDGGAERNTSRLWDDIDALITRNIPHFNRDEALEIPDDDKPDASSLSQELTPWPVLEQDEASWWSPPSPHVDLQSSPLPAFASPPVSDDMSVDVSPFEVMGIGLDDGGPDHSASSYEHSAMDLMGGDDGSDFDDGFPDLDGDLALTPEQEAELAALDAQLMADKQAATEGEKP